MSITMVFGSLIAGATSEGGGAVAFPVMTMVFKINPMTARDFSLIIQTVGMIAAAYTIIRLKIKIEKHAVLWGTIGGAIGICIGISWVAPRLSPAMMKLFFVSLWLSFGAALLWINRIKGRSLNDEILNFTGKHAMLLVFFGICGGCVSGMTGSGLDIVTFSMLTLAFRVSEKIATPTSVVLMGYNAGIGFLWRQFASTREGLSSLGAEVLPPIADEAWNYWYCCIWIVIIGAPMGARIITHFKRIWIVYILLASIAIQFVGGMFIVPWMELGLFPLIIGTFIAGCCLFGFMSYVGSKRDRLIKTQMRAAKKTNAE
jgi:uncharacterized membrane protein YfcA